MIIPAQSTSLYHKSTTVYSLYNYVTDNKPNALKSKLQSSYLIQEERYNNITNNNNNNGFNCDNKKDN